MKFKVPAIASTLALTGVAIADFGDSVLGHTSATSTQSSPPGGNGGAFN